jgi:hypothetical protein
MYITIMTTNIRVERFGSMGIIMGRSNIMIMQLMLSITITVGRRREPMLPA